MPCEGWLVYFQLGSTQPWEHSSHFQQPFLSACLHALKPKESCFLGLFLPLLFPPSFYLQNFSFLTKGEAHQCGPLLLLSEA